MLYQYNIVMKSFDKINEIASVLAATKDAESTEVFLRCLLTPKELGDVSSRWEIFKLLSAGVSQRKISEQLGVSLCKITRGSKELKSEQSVLTEMVSLFEKQKLKP